MTLRRRIAHAATQIDREYPSMNQQPEVTDEERDRRIRELLELCESGRAMPDEQQRGRTLQYVLDRARARVLGQGLSS